MAYIYLVPNDPIFFLTFSCNHLQMLILNNYRYVSSFPYFMYRSQLLTGLFNLPCFFSIWMILDDLNKLWCSQDQKNNGYAYSVKGPKGPADFMF